MFFVAKLIEALGIGYVTYALYVGFSQERSMGPELQWMMVGAAVFMVGWVIERKVSAQR
jgi:hypothetical protein